MAGRGRTGGAVVRRRQPHGAAGSAPHSKSAGAAVERGPVADHRARCRCRVGHFGKLSLWEAGVLAAVLAPTDTGLGQIMVNRERIPMRIRQATVPNQLWVADITYIQTREGWLYLAGVLDLGWRPPWFPRLGREQRIGGHQLRQLFWPFSRMAAVHRQRAFLGGQASQRYEYYHGNLGYSQP